MSECVCVCLYCVMLCDQVRECLMLYVSERVSIFCDQVRTTDAGGGEKWETVLIEVNDGYVAGRYDGMSISDYTDMILSRFRSLQNTAVGRL